MEAQKFELLAILKAECQKYGSIPNHERSQRREKKQFINGLMTAARVMGISFDELDEIIKLLPKANANLQGDELSLPTYIRNNIEIEL